MDINVFLLCFNESVLLPHTIKHYKKYLPSCKITIYDNESTDNSIEIAKELGCSVVSWSSHNILNEDLQINLRNTVWKKCISGWIIMADMDEYVCVTEEDLLEETNLGTTVLKIKGYDMIGESTTIDLSDIDLQEIKKYVNSSLESKNLCFKRDAIRNMNYGPGSHTCNPTGNVKYSSKEYINKHMSFLGLNFVTNKSIERYKRCKKMREKGWSVHYTLDKNLIKDQYTSCLSNCNTIT
jgi:hypothetical protein